MKPRHNKLLSHETSQFDQSTILNTSNQLNATTNNTFQALGTTLN